MSSDQRQFIWSNEIISEKGLIIRAHKNRTNDGKSFGVFLLMAFSRLDEIFFLESHKYYMPAIARDIEKCSHGWFSEENIPIAVDL